MWSLPEQAEAYVHRIGRTGRAGTSGIALSFCTSDEYSYLKDIQKLIKKNIDVNSSHPFAVALNDVPATPANKAKKYSNKKVK